MLYKNCSNYVFIILCSKEVKMEFFRNHRKLIVGIIAISFLLWTAGMGAFMLIQVFAG